MADRPKILVVDDEPSVGDALGLILTSAKYDVCVALNAEAGLAEIRKQRFDLAITDLRLPDMSGLDLLRKIAETHPDTPVVVITAHYASDVVAEALRSGAKAVLHKPFTASEILTAVRAACPKPRLPSR